MLATRAGSMRAAEESSVLPKAKVIQLRDPAEIELPPPSSDPGYAAVAAERAKLVARRAEAEQRERVAKARLRGQAPTVPAAERAQSLVAGASIVSTPAAAELEAAREEQRILHEAILLQNARLDQILAELSFQACKGFAPAMAEALRAALAAASQLHQALEVARVIRARLVGAGYLLNESALPLHLFPAGAALGNPDVVDGLPASRFKRWLVEKGIA
jgi:hypothetical protein